MTLPRLSSGTLMVLTHYLVFGLATIPAEAQSRADSLDVLVAVLDHFAADDAPLLLGDDVPQLVIDAAALRGGETLEVPSNVPVFCEGRLAEELITPEDLVGRRVFVSLRPGSGPLPTRVAQCDPNLYLFLVEHPDVVVNIWEVLKISQLKVRETEANKFQVEEKAGTLAPTRSSTRLLTVNS